MARITTEESLVHQLDLTTRKALGTAVQDLAEQKPDLDRAAVARRLNSARRKILEKARQKDGDAADTSFDAAFQQLLGAFEMVLQTESRNLLG